MRIHNVRDGMLIFLILILGCDRPPAKESLPDRIQIQETSAARALWWTSSNYVSGGKLGRLDLKTGEINRSVRTIGADTQLFQDGESGLLLLTRSNLDAVTALSGSDARVAGHYVLAARVSPQGVARDSLGRVWVTTLESNLVNVLASDLKSQVGQIDLSALQVNEPNGKLADLAQVVALDSTHMAVTAQRLHRSVRIWQADAQSGLAVLNTQTLQVESTRLVNLSNPIQAGVRGGELWVVGAGDLSVNAASSASLGHFAGAGWSDEIIATLPQGSNVLAADLSEPDAPPTLVVWTRAQNQSCIQVGTLTLTCEGSSENQGYVFNSVRRSGKRVYASYIGENKAELWILSVEGRSPIARVPMDMPLQSLSFGP